ncbi:unnamed protein product [Lasius platythorax]
MFTQNMISFHKNNAIQDVGYGGTPNCLEEEKAIVRAKKTNESQDGRFGNQDLMDATSGVDVGVARGCAGNAP